MKSFHTLATAALGLLVMSAHAAAPSDAPAGTNGVCKDGTYSSSAEKKGACRGHKGVKDWYAEGSAPMTAPSKSERAAPAAATTVSAAPAVRPTTPVAAGRTAGTPMEQPAAGGGAGKVWANLNSKVYHCSGDKYYGTTKHGEYMSETDAKAKGFHADHGKACA